MGRYIDIQNEVIKQYNVDICNGDKCENDWSRTHAHPEIRRVCKWKQANSIVSTFTLFHEIGHLETFEKSMRRCESEYAATVWAIKQCSKYGIVIEIPNNLRKAYQDYIFEEKERGKRRKGKNYPTNKELTLIWR